MKVRQIVKVAVAFLVAAVLVLYLAFAIGTISFSSNARTNPDILYSVDGPDIQNVTMEVSRFLVWARVGLSHPSANLRNDYSFWIGCFECQSEVLNGAVTVNFNDDGTIEIIAAPGWNVEAKGK